MNYSWLFSRILVFALVYFGIYSYSSLGDYAFYPLYTIFWLYMVLIGVVSILILALYGPIKRAVQDKPKKYSSYWWILGIADIGIAFLIQKILMFNNFQDQAGFMFWVILFAFISLIMGFIAARMRAVS